MTQWMHFLSRKILTFIHLTYLIYRKNQKTFKPYMALKNMISIKNLRNYSVLERKVGQGGLHVFWFTSFGFWITLFQIMKRISVM